MNFDPVEFASESAKIIGEEIRESAKLIREELQREVTALRDRIARLEEERSQLQYVGIWRSDADYKRGNFATTNGSLFHCEITGTK